MNRRRRIWITMAGLSCVTAGCAGPTVNIVQRSGPPSALVGTRAIELSLDSSVVLVEGQPLATYLERRGSEGAEMREIFGEMDAKLVEGLQETSGAQVRPAEGPPGPGATHILVRYVSVTPGHYAGFSNQDGEVNARVTYFINGQPTDELDITTRSRAVPAEEPTIRGRMHSCGHRLGELAGEYVRDAR